MSEWRKLETNEDLYYSPYNVTWKNERCVELALAFRWLELHQNIVEIGAVMPYYDENPYTPDVEKIIFNHDVIDPYDERATIPDFMENHDLSNKNVLAVSTIEHIGTTDYDGSGERQKVYDADLAPQALQQILNQSDSCFVTLPIGYNSGLDAWLEKNLHRLNCFGYHKTAHGFDLSGATWPPELEVKWEFHPDVKSIKEYGYRTPFPYANYILCIEGWK
jgi:hypothetical protein